MTEDGGDNNNDGMCALLPGPKVMKLADLVAQFTKAGTQNDVQVVDFSKMGIQPPLAVAIFTEISKLAETPRHVIH